MRKPRSGLGKLITLIGYSSGLPDISEARRPLPVSAPTYLCLDRPVSGLRAHQQTQSQWYQRFKHFTKLQIWISVKYRLKGKAV